MFVSLQGTVTVWRIEPRSADGHEELETQLKTLFKKQTATTEAEEKHKETQSWRKAQTVAMFTWT